MIFELYGFRSVVGKSVWSLNFLLSALVLIVFFVAPVWRVMASTSLSCPMGYKDMVPPTSASVFPQKRCVRVIDYASQFILVKESLDYYYKVILPCEGQPDSFPTCGHLWPSKFKPYQQIPPPASKNPSTPPVASQPTFEEGGSSRPICNPMQKSGPGCSGGGGISGKSDSSSPVTTSPPATRAGQGEGASASDSASRNGTGRNSTAPKNADAEQSGKNSESNSSDDKAKEGASSVADNSEGS
ncbi:MAG: hypothetical protein KDD35_09385, partial [Bdellovibrionales bacterium]|nr:hypothetical protein [Bdellovibrionales bacterium]